MNFSFHLSDMQGQVSFVVVVVGLFVVFFSFLFCSAGDQTQVLMHAKHTLQPLVPVLNANVLYWGR